MDYISHGIVYDAECKYSLLLFPYSVLNQSTEDKIIKKVMRRIRPLRRNHKACAIFFHQKSRN